MVPPATFHAIVHTAAARQAAATPDALRGAFPERNLRAQGPALAMASISIMISPSWLPTVVRAGAGDGK